MLLASFMSSASVAQRGVIEVDGSDSPFYDRSSRSEDRSLG